jgi:hypothetical protein
MTLDIPDHLAESRDLLVNGRSEDGIQMLMRAEFASDAVAQLLLGNLLAFDGRFDEALEIFDGATRLGDAQTHAALLGKARTLLELNRSAESLAAFERVGAERPDLGEAVEGRARALQQLGRDAEAEDAFRQYISMTARGADLRVRVSRTGASEP